LGDRQEIPEGNDRGKARTTAEAMEEADTLLLAKDDKFGWCALVGWGAI
jgi:hypothetical protein